MKKLQLGVALVKMETGPVRRLASLTRVELIERLGAEPAERIGSTKTAVAMELYDLLWAEKDRCQKMTRLHASQTEPIEVKFEPYAAAMKCRIVITISAELWEDGFLVNVPGGWSSRISNS